MEDLQTINAIARDLRNNPTPAERKLWKMLRKKQLSRCKFLRQHPIIYYHLRNKYSFFIADFYCAKKKLVIELDGPIHKFHRAYDNERDEMLRRKGLTVLHIKNEQLNDIESVKNIILEYLKKS